ncbi:MAG: exodeoxyribonuclease V subunit gamma [Candidatus Dactylopiibacterium sp.]|nr:exodeoxyribonuclease V subunit gamma [Candidatus Dactylopiibacterium sp.]
MQALPPGFMVIHGNHPESLRDLLIDWMRRHPLGALENETLLVQSNGIAQWLKLALARAPQDGGLGIAAALDMQLPSRFQWQAYRALLGAQAVPPQSPFDESLLVWRLMRLLPDLLAGPAFAPLAGFLAADDDPRKLHQLAARLADLFDQYQVYRADWLADWAAGHDEIADARGARRPLADEQAWQPALWRALLADVGPALAGSSRAAIHQRFIDAAAARAPDDVPPGLPRRLLVFGISSLPQQALQVLGAISKWTQVLMCAHNPCEHYWADIVADKDLLRAARARHARKPGMPAQIADDALHLHAHPLLAAWGKQGRDFIRLLDEHDDTARHAALFAHARIDLFDDNGGDSLLRQLQDDILALRPLAETRARWPALDGADASLRFHLAHSPQREVEILHDQLLHAFATDATLTPRDVIVMVPDINAYAPHIAAVFGLHARSDARHIPWSLADQGQRRHDPLLNALESLLQLPESRFEVSLLRDLLDVPALRARFGIAETQLPLLHRWVRAANIRWGLHGAQRESLGLPAAGALNTWAFGLRRMLLGYASGEGEIWQGIVPLDEIGGLDAALLGPLARLLETLETHWQALASPAAPATWGERLRALLADFFLTTDTRDGQADAYTLLRLDECLQNWLDACAAAALDAPLALGVVREHWLDALDQTSLGQPFFAGAVTFATLMPMRAIPFRRVCLLGMNDGDYPRTRVPMDFDLMGRDWRPGDRSRREDDRYLFLEALLAAREHLHVSWIARSIHDNSERAPSVLVAQLREHLAAGWRMADGSALLAAISVEHRMQPFNPDYFSGEFPALFSHAREWHAETVADSPAVPLPPHAAGRALTLAELADFLAAPVRAFFRQRLRVYFGQADIQSEDTEPFALDALARWGLQDELIQRLRGVPAAARGSQLAAGLERQRLGGDLPPAAFATLAEALLAEPLQALFARYDRLLAAAPDALAPLAIAHDEADGPRVEDWLDDLRATPEGARARIVLHSGALTRSGKGIRHEKLLPYWVAHLAAHLDGTPLTTWIASQDSALQLAALDPVQARAHWRDLLAAWRQGMCAPLPLAAASAFAFLARGEIDEARKCYETPPGPGLPPPERDRDANLARAWPHFADLEAAGFAELSMRLLEPVRAATREIPETAA